MRWSVLLLSLLFIPLVAGQAPTVQDVTLTGHDGIDINARLYTPAVTPAPAILITHGWNDNIDSTNTVTFAERYAALGYVVLAYDSRGWGKSGGEVELNGPSEVKDAQALITYLSTLDAVLQDGPDDPRVGMIGQSYAGGIQFLTAQVDPRIDAIAPFATWSNLMTSLAPGDVIKRGWVDLLFGSGQLSARGVKPGETDPTRFDPNPSGPMTPLTAWYAELTATNQISDDIRNEMGVVRSLSPGTLTTPTFLVQGWPDTLFTPSNALTTYGDLRTRGVDARIAFIHGGHGFGNYNTNEAVMTAVDDFFAQHLRDELPSMAPYPVLRYRYAEDDVVGELQWPPAGTAGTLWHLTDDGLSRAPGDLSQTLTVPPLPAYCTEISNFQGDTASQCGQGVSGTFHTFTAPPLDVATEVTGAAQLVVPIQSTQTQEVFLFFQLVDVAPDGSETPVLAQVSPFRDAATATSAFVSLPAVSHTFPAGHSIGVKVTTTDLTYHGAREAGQVTLGDSASPALLLLPTTPKDAHGDRQAPSVTRMSSFGEAIESESNNTQAVRFELRDNLAIGSFNVTASGANVNTTVLEATATRRLIEVLASTDTCGEGVVTVTAYDLAGLNASRTVDVVPCPPTPAVEEAPATDGKDSPAGWLVLPVLLGAFLRRRWA